MGVNKVQLTTGETIMDVSKNTVNEDVLYEGYTATNAQGEQIMGRAVPSSGAASDVLWVTADLNLSTMECLNLSHNAVEIKNALDNGKIVKVKMALHGFTMNLVLDVSYYSTVPNGSGYVLVTLNGFAYIDMGAGNTLYYVQSFINTNVDTLYTPIRTTIAAVNLTV